MADFARSAHPGVQAQLDRLAMLSPAGDRLGLERIRACSTGSAARRTAAAGLPRRRHQRQGLDLRLPARRARGGRLTGPRLHQPAPGPLQRADPDRRAADRRRAARRPARGGARRQRRHRAQLLRGDDRGAFLAFARAPADACILEVGLGGRLDATNVIDRPLVTGIASLGLDHQQFLGDRWSISPPKKPASPSRACRWSPSSTRRRSPA